MVLANMELALLSLKIPYIHRNTKVYEMEKIR